MSRIGSKLITLPDSVEVFVEDNVLIVKGPKGENRVSYPSKDILLNIGDRTISLEIKSGVEGMSAFQGLYRMLIYNAVIGVTEGFKKDLELSGVGYRVQKAGADLNFSLGYSHPIVFPAIKGIEFFVEGTNKITVFGIDKEVVGQVCANILSLRDARKDPYKNKGINIVGRKLHKKAGKVK